MHRAPASMNLVPLGRFSIAICECGQPASWSCQIPVGVKAIMHPYKLCDACLQLELELYQPSPKPAQHLEIKP